MVDVRTVLDGVSEIVLGIDEHSFRGQRTMITITCLAPVRRLLAILPDDRLATLRAYLEGIPADIRARIVGVCIDMKMAWRKEVERCLPHAQIVVDRFHVMQDANRRVDEARRLDQQVTGRAIPRWPLLKNEEELTPRQAEHLAAIRKEHRNVSHFHVIKEQLRDVYEAPDAATAAAILDRIILNAREGSDAALVQWGRTLKVWRENILAFHRLRITNAFTEGTHTKIKLLKRLSYGFRDPETYVRKMLLGLLPLATLVLTTHLSV